MNKIDFEKLKLKLKKEPDIIGRNNYFNSVVLVPFFFNGNTFELILQKRAFGIRQEGEICFPGGGFEKEIDKNFESCAVRETSEELGLSGEKIKIHGKIGTLINPFATLVEVYFGELNISSINDLDPNINEVEKIITVPIDYFLKNKPETYSVKLFAATKEKCDNGKVETIFPAEKLNLPQKYHNKFGGKKINVYVYKVENEVVWGITAHILRELTLKITKGFL